MEMLKLLKCALACGCIAIVVIGFIVPTMAIYFAGQIIKFGAIYLILNIACKMALHRSLIDIIRAGLKRNDED